MEKIFRFLEKLISEGWYSYQRNPQPLTNPNIQFLSLIFDLNRHGSPKCPGNWQSFDYYEKSRVYTLLFAQSIPLFFTLNFVLRQITTFCTDKHAWTKCFNECLSYAKHLISWSLILRFYYTIISIHFYTMYYIIIRLRNAQREFNKS